MSRTKQEIEKSDKTEKVEKNRTPRNKKPARKNTGRIVAIILGCTAALTCIFITIWYTISASEMKEIETEDNTVQALLDAYFFGSPGCFDYENSVFDDKAIDVNKFSRSAKENIVISYLAYNRYSSMTYDQLNEVYHTFFGEKEDLTKKTTYSVAEGTYTLKDRGTYSLAAVCAPPKITTCVIAEKAYKNNNSIKVIMKVMTIDRSTGSTYAGIDMSVDALKNDIDQLSVDLDLPRWEVEFKKNTTGIVGYLEVNDSDTDENNEESTTVNNADSITNTTNTDNADRYIIKSTHPVK